MQNDAFFSFFGLEDAAEPLWAMGISVVGNRRWKVKGENSYEL